MPDDSNILFEKIAGKDGSLGVITLNRQQALNALNHQMFLALEAHLRQWATDDEIKAVVIKAAPGRAFCAGGDLRAVYEQGKQDYQGTCKFFADEYRLNQYIFHYPKPYIALLDGMTMGGGAGISIHGSHPVATENLHFSMPETGIGFFTDIGASYFLSRLPDQTGMYLGLTGKAINAIDCLELGIVKHLVKSEHLESIIEELIVMPKNEVKFEVDSILASYRYQPDQAALLNEHRSNILDVFSGNSIEAIMSHLKNKHDDWSRNTLEKLQTKSPMSLKIVYELLKRGVELDFDSCMKMEYNLACHILKNHDFYEGIRALIIEKDKKPQWRPMSLSAITEEQVDNYFKPKTF